LVYRSANDLNRSVNEVLLESELKDALIRLNLEINAKPELADEVIYKLRAILISVNQIVLVKANEEFFKWLGGDKTMPFGENIRHVQINLFDFKTSVITLQIKLNHFSGIDFVSICLMILFTSCSVVLSFV
jgi:type I restriction enzyme R subunit